MVLVKRSGYNVHNLRYCAVQLLHLARLHERAAHARLARAVHTQPRQQRGTLMQHTPACVRRATNSGSHEDTRFALSGMVLRQGRAGAAAL
jgi:hypothetical protein